MYRATGTTEARVEMQRLSSLYRLTDALAREPRIERALEPVLRCAREALNAPRVSVHLFDDDGTLDLRASHELPPALRVALEGRLPWHTHDGASARAFSPLTTATDAALPCEALRRAGVQSVAVAPIVVHARLQGWLGVYFDDPRNIDPVELSLLEAIAGHLACALERSAEGDVATDGGAARFRALARASRLFAQAGLALDEVLRSVVREVGSALGDASALYLVTEDAQWLEPVALHHRVPEAAPILEAAYARARLPFGTGIIGTTVAARQSAFLPVLADGFFHDDAKPDERTYLDRFGVGSLIVAPLAVQGRTLGALAISRMRHAPPYTGEDRLLLESLADHAALAIENARSFAAEQQTKLEATLATRWLERRQAATEALTAAVRPDEVIEAALDAAADALSPDSGAVCLLEEGGVRVRGSFVREGAEVRRARAPHGHGVLYARAALETEPLFLERADEIHARWPDMGALMPSLEAIALVPLSTRERPLGVLVVGFERERPFSRGERGYLDALARQASVSLERAQLFAEVKAREEEALRVAEFQNQLLGIVGHDLRNPLAAIRMGAAVLARMVEGNERQSKLLARIISSTDRGDRLIRELLDFTRARIGGGIPIERGEVDLLPLARGLVEELEAAHPGREIRLHAKGDACGAWDAGRMAQVISNLLTNALLYSPRDSDVSLFIDGDGDVVRVTTHNFGDPIPQDRLGTVFEPFCRFEGRPDGTKSLGLGLYIVREVVRAHDGVVTVRSSAERGTEFRVELPRTPISRPARAPATAPAVAVRTRA